MKSQSNSQTCVLCDIKWCDRGDLCGKSSQSELGKLLDAIFFDSNLAKQEAKAKLLELALSCLMEKGGEDLEKLYKEGKITPTELAIKLALDKAIDTMEQNIKERFS